MKQVLIVDANDIFQEFLKDKLSLEGISVVCAESRRDAFTKSVSLIPDLIILNVEKNFYDAMDFFEHKMQNRNTKSLPVVICGPVIENEKITDLVKYGVVKYFYKPIRFDVLISFLAKTLKIPFSMDTTECILELHINNDILFVEVAQGLNREKLMLLKYKIRELLDNSKLENPKVIIMLTGLKLSFVDGINLELLLNSVLADPRISRNQVKVLSFDSFTKDLIAGHPEYSDIEVVQSLQDVLFSVVETEEVYDMADFINRKILSSTVDSSLGSVEMNFNPTDMPSPAPASSAQSDDLSNIKQNTSAAYSLALVDDDVATLKYLNSIFAAGYRVYMFKNGQDFLSAVNKTHFDVTILDLNMPGMPGLEVLKILQSKRYIEPIMVYSAVKDKEAIYKSISYGARTFLPKAQKAEVLLQKVESLINQDDF